MRFVSKYKNYKIWLKPSYYRFDTTGRRVFVQGVFAQFTNGFFETEDKETIDLLKKAKTYGIDFWSADEPSPPNPEGLKEEEKKKMTKETLLTDCPECGKTFKNRSGLMGHLAIVHRKE